MELQAKEKNKINIYMCVSYIYKDWEIKTERRQIISLFKSPTPRKKKVFFFCYWKKRKKKEKVHDAHGLLKEGAGNTPEEHSTLPTFPCNDIDLSFGCSISPALWAEGTVQDSSHCQGREEEISREWWCPPAGLILSRLHTLNTGMVTQEVATSKWEEEAKGREKPNGNKNNNKKNHVIATEVIH